MAAPISIRLAAPPERPAEPRRRPPAAWFEPPPTGRVDRDSVVRPQGGDMNTVTTPTAPATEPGRVSVDGDGAGDKAAPPLDLPKLPQLSLAGIIGVWAAAAIPMAVLAWIV